MTIRQRVAILAVFSMSILASEIALTRLFSVIFWYHFGFLILSTALLGFGLGGLLVSTFKSRLADFDPDRVILWGVGASGVLLVFALYLVTHNKFSPLFVQDSAQESAKLILATLAFLVPFTAMGATVLFTLQSWPQQVGKLYAANLLGSALGCLAALGVMELAGGLWAYLLLAALMPILAFVASWKLWRRDAFVFAALGLALLLVLPAMEHLFPMNSPSDKPAAWARNKELVFTDWTSLSKVDIYAEQELHASGYGLWGLSLKNTAPLPERLAVLIDHWAYTTIIRDKPDSGYYDFYDALPMYLAYKIKPKAEALVMGSGGGMDIRGALHYGARHVDAVEINPSIVRAMRTDLEDYSGGVYTDSRVTSYLAEGRHFVETMEKQYDIVQLSGVDTYSSTQAGAFALSENYLYTVEAVTRYLDLMKDDGVLTLTRWYSPGKNGHPRFSMRLFTLIVDSLAQVGVTDAARNVVFLRSGTFTVILAKKQPFTEKELLRLESDVGRWGYLFLYHPEIKNDDSLYFDEYINSSDRQAWLEAYPFNVAAPTDDNPFFFEHRKFSKIHHFQSFLPGLTEGLDGQTILVLLLLELLLVAGVMLVISFRLAPPRRRLSGGLRWLYFVLIGLGFMFVEIGLSQQLILFLGHPVYALSVVIFGVLLFSGLGALAAPQLARRIPIPPVLALGAGLILVMSHGLIPQLASLMQWGQVLRMLVVVLMMAPIAFIMGLAFPEAIRRLTAQGIRDFGVEWAWNGLGSVAASVLAVMVAVSIGFSVVFTLAAICYVLAAILLVRL